MAASGVVARLLLKLNLVIRELELESSLSAGILLTANYIYS